MGPSFFPLLLFLSWASALWYHTHMPLPSVVLSWGKHQSSHQGGDMQIAPLPTRTDTRGDALVLENGNDSLLWAPDRPLMGVRTYTPQQPCGLGEATVRTEDWES